MGGTAREAFVSIAIPDDCPIEFIEELYEGIKNLAARYAVNVLGGDTTGSKIDLIINIAVTGSVLKNEVLFRNGAKPGDLIACTGFPGESRAGLHFILEKQNPDSQAMKHLLDAHILPEPHLHEGRFLAEQGGVTACLDVSDGLSSDLGHILEESGVGARLFTEKIPISSHLETFCRKFSFQPLEYALSGGEDYFLLCSLNPNHAEEIAAGFTKTFSRPLYLLGEITDGHKMMLVESDGREREISPSGWDHFTKEG
jgi:thiamine-monophosphate kinase